MNYFIAGVMRPCFVPPALMCAGATQHLAPLRLGGCGGPLPTVLSLLAEVCDSVILIVPCVPSLGGWESGQDGGGTLAFWGDWTHNLGWEVLAEPQAAAQLCRGLSGQQVHQPSGRWSPGAAPQPARSQGASLKSPVTCHYMAILIARCSGFLPEMVSQVWPR